MAEKEEKILSAARALFAQFGLKKVTTDDIAKEARMSKATIYRLYKNKSEIFNVVVDREADELLEIIREAVDEEKTVIGKLRAHLKTRIETIGEFINFCRVTKDNWGEYWPHVAHVRERFLAGEKGIVKEILEAGVHNNELVLDNIDLSSHILVVGLTSIEYNWAVAESGVTLSHYIDTMLKMMIEGIKKR